jgi:hypothetical protein
MKFILYLFICYHLSLVCYDACVYIHIIVLCIRNNIAIHSCCSKREKTNNDDNTNKIKSDFVSKIKETKNEGVLVGEAKKVTKRHNARCDFHVFSLAMLATPA